MIGITQEMIWDYEYLEKFDPLFFDEAPGELEVVWSGQSFNLKSVKEYYNEQIGDTL